MARGLGAEGALPEVEDMLRKACCGATPILVFVSFDDEACRKGSTSSDDRLDEAPSVITNVPLVCLVVIHDGYSFPHQTAGNLISS